MLKLFVGILASVSLSACGSISSNDVATDSRPITISAGDETVPVSALSAPDWACPPERAVRRLGTFFNAMHVGGAEYARAQLSPRTGSVLFGGSLSTSDRFSAPLGGAVPVGGEAFDRWIASRSAQDDRTHIRKLSASPREDVEAEDPDGELWGLFGFVRRADDLEASVQGFAKFGYSCRSDRILFLGGSVDYDRQTEAARELALMCASSRDAYRVSGVTICDDPAAG